MPEPKFIIIDGNHLVHRAYWAIPNLKAQDGTPTNAIFGFFSTFLNLLQTHNPKYIAITFDSPEKTFRHQAYSEYKALRPEAPDNLKIQFPLIQSLIESVNIALFKQPGVESDDLIATLVKLSEKNSPQIKNLVLSGDMDLFQLLSNYTEVLKPQNGGKILELDRAKFIEKYELEPNQIIDFKGLSGDSSDNLKGVRGIGKKTALSLIHQFGSLQNIYNNLDDVKSKSVRNKLETDRDSAFECFNLAKLKTDCEINFNLEQCRTDQINFDKLLQAFEKYRFFMLIKRLKKMDISRGEITDLANSVFQEEINLIPQKSSKPKEVQLSLF